MNADDVRPARPDDLRAIRAVARAAYAPYVERLGFEPPPMVQDFVEVLPSTIVFDDGAVRGYAVRRVERTHMLLENVAADPAVRGRGVGRTLIARVEAEAAALGLPVELYTNEAMHENLALYPRLGYAEFDRRTEHGLHRVFFRKRP